MLTYTKIATVTVGAGGASTIDFSNIPQTFMDLQVVVSGRQSGSAVTASLNITLNTSSSTFTYRALQGSGSAASSFSGSTGYLGQTPAATATTSTFGNASIYIPQYTGNSYKSIGTETVDETNATTTYAQMNAVLWSNTAAINSLSLVSGNGVFAQYSSATLYGIGYQPKATGGTISSDGTYWYHAFTSTGLFTPSKNLQCDVLVVAGGGGGAGSYGAGGGAGGLRTKTLPVSYGSSIAVTVGAGGAGGTSANGLGINGNNSGFATIISSGGGYAYGGDFHPGGSGGSGGGGTRDAGGSGNSGGFSPSEGYAGGSGYNGPPNYTGGGGGGATAVGTNGTSTVAGSGGAGSSLYSSWGIATGIGHNVSGTYYFAGGGGSGTYQGGTNGTGGNGGGGNGGTAGTTSSGTAGSSNTGGGGGGASYQTNPNTGGSNGGSGVVIIRYKI